MVNEYYGQDRGYSQQYRDNRGQPQNWGSARSDYGQLAYGGDLNYKGEQRGWLDRTADEVTSWFGDEGAERRRRLDRSRDAFRNREHYDRDSGGSYGRRNYPGGRGNGHDTRRARAADLMTRNIATVHPNDRIEYAAQLMGQCDCGAVPVVDRQGRMIGMVTDRDIAIRIVGNGVDTMRARVGDCMTDEVFACHVNDSLDDCMRMMKHHQIRRVPVIDDRDRIVGIISQADLAQHAGELHGRGQRRAVSDVVCAVSEPTSGSYA